MKNFTFFIIIFSFIACVKENDSIVIGDKNDMILIEYNKTIDCGPDFGIIWIDPSHSGNNNYWIDIPCGGKPLGASMSSTPYLNTNEKIGGEIVEDTLYTSKKISIYFDTIYWNKMVKNTSIITGCKRLYGDDSIKLRKLKIVHIYKEGDIIFKDSDFITGQTYLKSSTGSINPYLGYKGDTIILESNHWDTDCHKLPSEGTFYLAIKIAEYDNNNQQVIVEKLGWLKFAYNSQKQLVFIESAIQE